MRPRRPTRQTELDPPGGASGAGAECVARAYARCVRVVTYVLSVVGFVVLSAPGAAAGATADGHLDFDFFDGVSTSTVVYADTSATKNKVELTAPGERGLRLRDPGVTISVPSRAGPWTDD
jgi:hypothetical protein